MKENNGPQDKKIVKSSKEKQGEIGRTSTYILTFSLMSNEAKSPLKVLQAIDAEWNES